MAGSSLYATENVESVPSAGADFDGRLFEMGVSLGPECC